MRNPEGVAADRFLSAWLAENIHPSEFQLASDLAQKCREDALAAGIAPVFIERRLGATIEEAIMDAINALHMRPRNHPRPG